ncbi:hypothetical protein KQ878_00370 [Mycoplasma zalophidermidis]|uniref:Uncharacterized protein n=1 Tax=Mycoplasma zalophidermidis TaxID=398174 RepID=A0ABS6DQR0_9MOLU|nr:hypothetical protein [Mycoplasma zalophidermidis]MBU4693340.1 hypothetical protein [Mycoplasma zalophidermidis]
MKRKIIQSIVATATISVASVTILAIIDYYKINNLNFINKPSAIKDIKNSKNRFEMAKKYDKYVTLNQINKLKKITEAKKQIRNLDRLTEVEIEEFIKKIDPTLIIDQTNIDVVVDSAHLLNNSRSKNKYDWFNIDNLMFIEKNKKILLSKQMKELLNQNSKELDHFINTIKKENEDNKLIELEKTLNLLKQLTFLTKEDVSKFKIRLLPNLIKNKNQIDNIVNDAEILNLKRKTIRNINKAVSVVGDKSKVLTINKILDNKNVSSLDVTVNDFYLNQINQLIKLAEDDQKPRHEIKEAVILARQQLKDPARNVREIYNQLVDSTIKFTNKPNKLEGVNIFHVDPPVGLFRNLRINPSIFKYISGPNAKWSDQVQKYLAQAKEYYQNKFNHFIEIATDPRVVNLKDKHFYGSYFYTIVNRNVLKDIYDYNLGTSYLINSDVILNLVETEAKKSTVTKDFNYIDSINKIVLEFSKCHDRSSYYPGIFMWDKRNVPVYYYKNIEDNYNPSVGINNNYNFVFNPYLKELISEQEIKDINQAVDFSINFLRKNNVQFSNDNVTYVYLNAIFDPNNKINYLDKIEDETEKNNLNKVLNEIEILIKQKFDKSIFNTFQNIKKTLFPSYIMNNSSFQELAHYIFTNGNLYDFSFLSFMIEYDPGFGYSNEYYRAPTQLWSLVDDLPISNNFEIQKDSLKNIFIEFHQLLDTLPLKLMTPEQLLNKLKQNKLYDFISKYQMFVNNLDHSDYRIDENRDLNTILLELKSSIYKCKELNVKGIYFDVDKLEQLLKTIDENDSRNKLTLQIINLFLLNDLLYNKYPSRFNYRFFGLGERAINTITDVNISRLNSLYPLIKENIELFKSGNYGEKISQNEYLKNILFDDFNNMSSSFLGKITSANKSERQDIIVNLLSHIDDIIKKVSAIPDLKVLKTQLDENKSIIQEIVKKIDNETDLSFNYKVRLDALKPISDADFYDELSKKGREYIRLMVAVAPFGSYGYSINEFIELFTEYNKNNSDNVILNSLFADKKYGFIQKYGESDTLYSSSHHYFNDYVSAEWKSEWDSKKHLLDQFKDDIHIGRSDNNNYANSISLSESNKNKFRDLNSMVSNIFDSLKSKLFNTFISHFKMDESKDKFDLNKLSKFSNYSDYSNVTIENVKNRYDKVYKYLSNIIYNVLLQVDGNVLKKIGDEFGWDIYNKQLFLFVTMNIAQNYDKIKDVLDKLVMFINSLTVEMTDTEVNRALNMFINNNREFIKSKIESLDKLNFASD